VTEFVLEEDVVLTIKSAGVGSREVVAEALAVRALREGDDVDIVAPIAQVLDERAVVQVPAGRVVEAAVDDPCSKTATPFPTTGRPSIRKFTAHSALARDVASSTERSSGTGTVSSAGTVK
jgi:hypothetical protein